MRQHHGPQISHGTWSRVPMRAVNPFCKWLVDLRTKKPRRAVHSADQEVTGMIGHHMRYVGPLPLTGQANIFQSFLWFHFFGTYFAWCCMQKDEPLGAQPPQPPLSAARGTGKRDLSEPVLHWWRASPQLRLDTSLLHLPANTVSVSLKASCTNKSNGAQVVSYSVFQIVLKSRGCTQSHSHSLSHQHLFPAQVSAWVLASTVCLLHWWASETQAGDQLSWVCHFKCQDPSFSLNLINSSWTRLRLSVHYKSIAKHFCLLWSTLFYMLSFTWLKLRSGV